METKTGAYSPEIQRIHYEFMTAGDKLLKEALSVIDNTDNKLLDKGRRLTSIGFVATEEVKLSAKLLALKTEKEKLYRIVEYYHRKYPNNKFITPEQVDIICKKYNLVCGPLSSYKGFVPDEKLSQIEKFSCASDDTISCYIKVIDWTYPGSDKRAIVKVEEMYPDGLIPMSEDINGTLNAINVRGNYLSISRYHKIDVPKFLICAPKKDMNLKGLSKLGVFFSSLTSHTVPDPVVLKSVKDGYLVVTAWGEEASDPIVVNQKFN